MDKYLPQLSESAWRWARFAGLLAALFLLGWASYYLRGVLTPLLAALAIAYILNPVVTWFERRHVSRLATVTVVFVVLGFVVVLGGLWAAARIVAQIGWLVEQQNRLLPQIESWIAANRWTWHADTLPATQPTAPDSGVLHATLTDLLRQHGLAVAGSSVTYIANTLTNLATVFTLLGLVPMYTFFFLWHFNTVVATVRDHLPAAYRPTIVHTVQTIDAAMASFFRGRLLVCMCVGLLSAIGWSFTGVGPSLLLGALAGIVNLVPFMSLLVLPLALISAYLGFADGTSAWVSWSWPVALTMAVYIAVQAIESFLLSPLIEGKSSGLHPMVIVVALLIGAELAGLLGMLLAIPVTSTLRTLAGEWLLPEIRRLAHGVAPPAGAPPPDAGPPMEANAGPAAGAGPAPAGPTAASTPSPAADKKDVPHG